MRSGLSYSECGRLGAEASKKTNQRLKEERIEKYNLTPTRCKNCNTSFDYKHRHNKFCNKSCSARFNNKGVRRHGKDKGECLFCGKELTRNGMKYCSNRCQRDKEWELRKKEIERTGSESSSYVAKRYLMEKSNNCCICSGEKWMGKPIPLVMDHIDGNSDNNMMTNLRLVCGNCDMQLPTYKSKNMGNGRAWRRKRYAEGKSY